MSQSSSWSRSSFNRSRTTLLCPHSLNLTEGGAFALLCAAVLELVLPVVGVSSVGVRIRERDDGLESGRPDWANEDKEGYNRPFTIMMEKEALKRRINMKTCTFLCFHVNFEHESTKHACFYVNFPFSATFTLITSLW